MVQSSQFLTDLTTVATKNNLELNFCLPDPEDDQIPEEEFQQQISTAWQVCDRFDLQTDIWRGKILRAVRDREKQGGDGRGTGFLNWLRDHEITKSQAYRWIEMANSADTLVEEGYLEPEAVEQFSKRAFVETAQAAPEVQQMVSEAAMRGDRITRREVRQLADEWTAMTSDLIPTEVKEKAAASVIPTRYLAPLVRELEKLPETHQTQIQAAVAESPDIDTLKQVTAEARYLAKYLAAATQVQALTQADLDLEMALEEALRIGSLNATADLVNQASQLEQTIAKLYTTWRRLNSLLERVYLDSGASTPHLRSLLSGLNCFAGNTIAVQLGNLENARTIQLQIQEQ